MTNLRTICLAFAAIFTLSHAQDTVGAVKPNVATYLNYTSTYANPVVNVYTTAVQFGDPIQNTTGYNFVIDSTVK